MTVKKNNIKIISIEKFKLPKRYLLGVVITLILLNVSCFNTDFDLFLRPGVKVNTWNLKKEIFFEEPKIGSVTDIKYGELDRLPGKEIGIAGFYGVVYVDETGKRKFETIFSIPQYPMIDTLFVDIENDGQTELLRISGPAVGNDILLDHNGNEIWRTSFFPSKTDFGYIDGDDKLAFVFADNSIKIGTPGNDRMGQHSAMEILNNKGETILIKNNETYISDAHFADLNGDGKSEIFASNGDNLIVMDKAGEVLFTVRPPVKGLFADFKIVDCPRVEEHLCIMKSGNNNFSFLSLDGRTKILDLQGRYLSDPKATRIYLSKKVQPFYAITGRILYQGKQWFGLEKILTALYIYDPNGKLIYHEIFPEEGNAILSIHKNNGSEALLVGEKGKVWRYYLP